LLDFEDAPPILRREAAQIHQHSVCFARKMDKRCPPGIIMAKKIVYAEQAIRVRRRRALRHSLVQIILALDEGAGEPTVQEFEELVRFDRGESDVRAADQPYRTQVAPTSPKVLQETLRATAETEDAKEDERSRRDCRRALLSEP
jgi:hypothetical protein